MPFELGNFGRREEDKGKESPVVTLARIDENIKFLKSGAELVRIQLSEHEKKDDVKFYEINKTIWTVSGGACVIIFIINLAIAWSHK